MTVDRNCEFAATTLAHDVDGIEGRGAKENSSLRLLGAADGKVALGFVLGGPPVNAASVLAMLVLPPNDGNFSKECREVKLATLGVLLNE